MFNAQCSMLHPIAHWTLNIGLWRTLLSTRLLIALFMAISEHRATIGVSKQVSAREVRPNGVRIFGLLPKLKVASAAHQQKTNLTFTWSTQCVDNCAILSAATDHEFQAGGDTSYRE
jgi:hypothetical protein